jgi:hypothetical protein
MKYNIFGYLNEANYQKRRNMKYLHKKRKV